MILPEVWSKADVRVKPVRATRKNDAGHRSIEYDDDEVAESDGEARGCARMPIPALPYSLLAHSTPHCPRHCHS